MSTSLPLASILNLNLLPSSLPTSQSLLVLRLPPSSNLLPLNSTTLIHLLMASSITRQPSSEPSYPSPSSSSSCYRSSSGVSPVLDVIGAHQQLSTITPLVSISTCSSIPTIINLSITLSHPHLPPTCLTQSITRSSLSCTKLIRSHRIIKPILPPAPLTWRS